jgi:hypothetical protein
MGIALLTYVRYTASIMKALGQEGKRYCQEHKHYPLNFQYMLQNQGHEPNMHMLFFIFPVYILFCKSTEGNADGRLTSHHSELTVSYGHMLRRFQKNRKKQQIVHPDCQSSGN